MDDIGASPSAPKTKTKGASLDMKQPTENIGGITSQATSEVTATTVDISIIRKAVPQSGVSKATSNSLYERDWALLPPLPAEVKLGKEFICDYCGLLLQARQASDVKFWAEHIRKDLDPYVCVFDECDTPYQIFSSSREWLAHMRSQHRMRWHCFATTHTLSSFESLDALEDHMRQAHAGQFSNEEISFLAENSGHPMKAVIEHCPFCQETSDNTEEHVARHLIQFALRSLPWPDDCSYDHQTSQASLSGYSERPVSSSAARTVAGGGDEMPDMRETDWDKWEEEIQALNSSSNDDQDQEQNESSSAGQGVDVVGLDDFMVPNYNVNEDKLMKPFRRRASLADAIDWAYEESPTERKACVRILLQQEMELVRVLQVLCEIYKLAINGALAVDGASLKQIYGNMDRLAYLHQQLLDILKPTAFFEWSSPVSYTMFQRELIEKIFLEDFREIGSAHHEYSKIHDRAVAMWKSTRKRLKNQSWMKQCDQLSQDKIGREYSHNQFEELHEIVNDQHGREYYVTWLNTLRQPWNRHQRLTKRP